MPSQRAVRLTDCQTPTANQPDGTSGFTMGGAEGRSETIALPLMTKRGLSLEAAADEQWLNIGLATGEFAEEFECVFAAATRE